MRSAHLDLRAEGKLRDGQVKLGSKGRTKVPHVCATGWTTGQYGQIKYGAGRHLAALSPHDPVESQKYAYAAQILLLPALTLPKMSICCAYPRIFYTAKWSRHMIQGLLGAPGPLDGSL
ncbi:hypothetical protein ACEQ8H_007254 [Pleosporales sp. CAS-2024a]